MSRRRRRSPSAEGERKGRASERYRELKAATNEYETFASSGIIRAPREARGHYLLNNITGPRRPLGLLKGAVRTLLMGTPAPSRKSRVCPNAHARPLLGRVPPITFCPRFYCRPAFTLNSDTLSFFAVSLSADDEYFRRRVYIENWARFFFFFFFSFRM